MLKMASLLPAMFESRKPSTCDVRKIRYIQETRNKKPQTTYNKPHTTNHIQQTTYHMQQLRASNKSNASGFARLAGAPRAGLGCESTHPSRTPSLRLRRKKKEPNQRNSLNGIYLPCASLARLALPFASLTGVRNTLALRAPRAIGKRG